MITFEPLSASHKVLFDNLPSPISRSSDFNFFNQYVWKEVMHTEIFHVSHSFILKRETPNCFRFYCYGDVEKMIDEILQFFVWKKKIVYLLASQISDKMKQQYDFEIDEDQNEYIYRFENIVGLKGQKLQKKRNHLNFFLHHTHHILQFPVDMAAYKEKILSLFTNNEEKKAFLGYAEYPESLVSLLPLAIIQGEEVLAFTLGDIVGDTCIVHFERAQKEIRGSYQAIFYYLLEQLRGRNISWINREQDLGLEHLRKAKRSYYPDAGIEKYRLVF